jgi:hypothetical protein
MKQFKLFALLIISAGILCSGCDPDKSGATQVMPKSSEGKAVASVPGANLPPEAQKSLQSAADNKSAGK